MLESFVRGEWTSPPVERVTLYDSNTGEPMAEAPRDGCDFRGAFEHARQIGGPALRAMGFHRRARLLKAMAARLNAAKEELYALSHRNGATRHDAWIDVDGGIGTLIVYANKGLRELPDDVVVPDGELERTSREGTFVGQHILVSRRGVSFQIDGWSEPVSSLLRRVAPALLAGMPVVANPATVVSPIVVRALRAMLETPELPEGALQLGLGAPESALQHLGSGDVLYTSAVGPRSVDASLLSPGLRLSASADSRGFIMLAPDAAADSDEHTLFVDSVVQELRTRAGQRGTTARRLFVPAERLETVGEELAARLRALRVGHAALEQTELGPLVSHTHRAGVREAVQRLVVDNAILCGDTPLQVSDADPERGAFFPATVVLCRDPDGSDVPHALAARGPVCTLMPYRDLGHACALIRRSDGAQVGTVVTALAPIARQVVLETASQHGRLQILNRRCAAESTGHGTPLPHLVHGGPGGAGGGEELGGLRALGLHLQRTALQGHPSALAEIAGVWLPAAARTRLADSPLRADFESLRPGQTWTSHARTVGEADLVAYRGVSGDFSGAAIVDDGEGLRAPPALIWAMVTGLLSNTVGGPGLPDHELEGLRVERALKPGDSIRARITCRELRPLEPHAAVGLVTWALEILDQRDACVATGRFVVRAARRAEASKPT